MIPIGALNRKKREMKKENRILPTIVVSEDPKFEFCCTHPRTKDLGHFWLGYIRMLGHTEMSAHVSNIVDIGT